MHRPFARRPRRRRTTALAAFVVAVALAPGAALAHSYKLGAISIGHVWAKPAAAGGTAAVFGPVFNAGETPVTLAGVATPIAARAGFCTERDGEPPRWREGPDIAPGKALAMAAWRVHICLEDIDRDLAEGDSFPLTLDFGPAGTKEVTIAIEPQAGH